MSTFFGGEQLVNIDFNRTSYTCPAGRYAKIILLEANAGTVVTIGSTEVNLSGGIGVEGRIIQQSGVGQDDTFVPEQYIEAGESVSGTGLLFHVFEYLIP